MTHCESFKPFLIYLVTFMFIINVICVSTASKDDFVSSCKCTNYWKCVDRRGIPFSYCGLNRTCCYFTDATLSQQIESRGEKCGIRTSSNVPWHVNILIKTTDDHVCDASFIDGEWFLTGAHCVAKRNISSIKIHIESNFHKNHQDIEMKKIVIHPKFNSKTLANDVALIQTLKSPHPSSDIGFICIPSKNEFNLTTAEKLTCTIFGPGNGEKGNQRESAAQILSRKKCQQILRQKLADNKYQLPRSTFCAKITDQNICNTKGQALICKQGNVEYEFGLSISGCDDKESPVIYTNIAHFWPWISRTLENN